MTSAKLKVQQFGRFLSNMVMPNIGAFIAWGLITALFIPKGWWPNETLATFVGPMITYLLPLLIGYTGGKLTGGERGAIVGAITTMGVIVGSNIPMFLGSMIAGPLGGWAIRAFDKAVDGKIKSGFEMLVNNFSVGIIGGALAIAAFYAISPTVVYLTELLRSGVDFLVSANLLPLTSLLVEPGKILFLNNAINHGIFTPLGTGQAKDIGYSIFFLIEANPGPGLGVLIAYMLFGRGDAKLSAPGAVIIHFFGGIHEIYFPYVLMNPRLLIAVILGGMTGVATLMLLHAGLIAPASPGSIVAVLLMTPKNAYLPVILAVALAFLVSFLVSSFLLKLSKNDELSLENATQKVQSMKESKKQAVSISEQVSTIYVACDAGMGSSATGASILRRKLAKAGLEGIEVINIAINDLPRDARLVITHKDLTPRAKNSASEATHFSLNDFLDDAFYNEIINLLISKKTKQSDSPTNFILKPEHIFLGLEAKDKENAIRFAGEKLVSHHFVDENYITAMFQREEECSTYLGKGIAMPHGTIHAKDSVLKTGVVFCQYPEGVAFGEDGEKAYLVIAIAACNNDHINIISALTKALDNPEDISILKSTDNIDDVIRILS